MHIFIILRPTRCFNEITDRGGSPEVESHWALRNRKTWLFICSPLEMTLPLENTAPRTLLVAPVQASIKPSSQHHAKTTKAKGQHCQLFSHLSHQPIRLLIWRRPHFICAITQGELVHEEIQGVWMAFISTEITLFALRRSMGSKAIKDWTK